MQRKFTQHLEDLGVPSIFCATEQLSDKIDVVEKINSKNIILDENPKVTLDTSKMGVQRYLQRESKYMTLKLGGLELQSLAAKILLSEARQTREALGSPCQLPTTRVLMLRPTHLPRSQWTRHGVRTHA